MQHTAWNYLRDSLHNTKITRLQYYKNEYPMYFFLNKLKNLQSDHVQTLCSIEFYYLDHLASFFSDFLKKEERHLYLS